jgi:hypothetical protein
MSIEASLPTDQQAVPDVPLTTRSVRMRQDMLNNDNTAKKWRDSWPILRRYLNDSELRPVIRSSSGETINIPPKPRTFSRPWLEKAYVTILDGDREIRDRFEDCSTALITLTASGYNRQQHYAPVDHYRDLDRSWTIPAEQIPGRESDRHPIYEHLKELGEYEYVRIDGVHDGRKEVQSGSNNRYYSHRHLLVYVNDDIDVPMLKNVFHQIIDTHLKYSPGASREQHQYSDAIRWDNNPSDGLKPIGSEDRSRGCVSPGARDIASHLADVHDGSTDDRMFASMMFALNKRAWSDSKGFRSAYRDRFEKREGVVHPNRWESDGDGDLVGWKKADGSFIPKPDERDESDDGEFMAMSKELPDYY